MIVDTYLNREISEYGGSGIVYLVNGKFSETIPESALLSSFIKYDRTHRGFIFLEDDISEITYEKVYPYQGLLISVIKLEKLQNGIIIDKISENKLILTVIKDYLPVYSQYFEVVNIQPQIMRLAGMYNMPIEELQTLEIDYSSYQSKGINPFVDIEFSKQQSASLTKNIVVFCVALLCSLYYFYQVYTTTIEARRLQSQINMLNTEKTELERTLAGYGKEIDPFVVTQDREKTEKILNNLKLIYSNSPAANIESGGQDKICIVNYHPSIRTLKRLNPEITEKCVELNVGG